VSTAPIGRSDRFGDIRPRRYRGGGGFSDVYEGVTTSGKRVALKVFRFQDNQSAKEIEKLTRERKVLARINSRGVAKYYDSNFQNDPPWIASEYVDGPTLKEAITSNGFMNAQSTELLIHQISSALSEIHKENVAHRDLSPNNVILGPDGPVIIDFGSSRLTDSSQGLVSILTSGTPGYLSPEAQSGSDASTPADVFAIAKIAEFALTGESDSPRSEKLNQLSPNLARVLYQALEIDPSERPTAQQILDASQPNYESLKEISASNYPEIKLKKIPIRFRLRSVLALAFLFLIITVFVSQRLREAPITTSSLISYIEEQTQVSPDLITETIARDGGVIRKFKIPSTFSQKRTRLTDIPNPSFLDIDAINVAIEPPPRETYLDIVATVTTDSEIDVLKLSDKSEMSLEDDQLTELLGQLRTETSYRQENYVPASCKFTTPSVAMVDIAKQSIYAIAITKDCVFDDEMEFHIVSIAFYPKLNLLVRVSGFFDPTEISMADFLESIEVSDRNTITENFDGERDLLDLAQYPDESGRLLWDDGSDDGFYYSRTALRLRKSEAVSLLFSNSQEDNFSIWGFVVSDEISNILIPFGRLWTFKDDKSIVLSNNDFEELILIVELDAVTIDSRSSIKIEFTDPNKTTKILKAENLTLGIGQLIRSKSFSYVMDNEFFSLPSLLNQGNKRTFESIEIGGIQMIVPASWSQLSVPNSANPKTPVLFSILNSGSDFIELLEADLPQLRIIDESLGFAQTRRDGLAWINSDDLNCSSRTHFSYESDQFFIEWVLRLSCEIPDAAQLRGEEGKLQQAAPIFQILISDRRSETNEELKPRLRIDFVPETIEDLDYLKDMILSLKPAN
jgi:serine/threonine protein kinase